MGHLFSRIVLLVTFNCRFYRTNCHLCALFEQLSFHVNATRRSGHSFQLCGEDMRIIEFVVNGLVLMVKNTVYTIYRPTLAFMFCVGRHGVLLWHKTFKYVLHSDVVNSGKDIPIKLIHAARSIH
jgi:hypothetical protein